MALRFWKFGAAAAVAWAIAASAQAGLLPLSATVVPDGDNYRYTYGVMLTSNSTLQKGDVFVVYDFNGLKAGSNEQPAGFEFMTTHTGGNPGRTVPNDNPDMPNLVWTYTGDTPLIGQIGLGNFSALSNKPESAASTDFVSRTHVEDPNGEVREEDNITHTKAPLGNDIQPTPTPDPEPTPTPDPDPEPTPTPDPTPGTPPGVPEPSSLLLLAAGLPVVAGVRAVRNRRKAAEVA
jgi:PEP-CTERM motif